ncbi:hypothetical protein BG005_006472 [Podila minutissima]|nr:hypothetical protein BG005_006472 [Podila minutissima]
MIALRMSNLITLFATVLAMSTAMGAAVPAVDGKGCYQCLIAPKCHEPCPEGQYCHIIQPQCHDCGSAQCKPLPK